MLKTELFVCGSWFTAKSVSLSDSIVILSFSIYQLCHVKQIDIIIIVCVCVWFLRLCRISQLFFSCFVSWEWTVLVSRERTLLRYFSNQYYKSQYLIHFYLTWNIELNDTTPIRVCSSWQISYSPGTVIRSCKRSMWRLATQLNWRSTIQLRIFSLSNFFNDTYMILTF